MTRVLKSDDGNSILVMDGKFAASRENGKWESGSLYDAYEISEFREVKSKAEAEGLLTDAHNAIKPFATA